MTVEQLVTKYPEEVSDLAIEARSFILKNIPDITEYPDEKANMIAYGFDNTYKDLICTIILSKKGIKIGFNKGSELNDPTGLLTGTGKVHKYVQITQLKDLKTKGLKNLLKEGLRAWKKRVK